MSSLGVLVMAYGTPGGAEELEAYYTHIRHGRAPTPELLAELRGRYEAIGGRSPLLAITGEQLAGLSRALADAGHPRVPIALGMKHSAPFIEDGIAELAAAGADWILGVVLAPHYSSMSVGEYSARALEAAARQSDPPHVSVTRSWHLDPHYLDYLTEALSETLAELPGERKGREHVLFTAHSLPTRVLGSGDPYPDQLQQTAEAVAARLDLARWSVAWQSAGRTPEPWIGPDVLEAMGTLAGAGVEAVVVCPAGFVADHLEILYDLDIEAAQRARELGIGFARTPMPNADPRIAAALSDAVLAQLPVGPAG